LAKAAIGTDIPAKLNYLQKRIPMKVASGRAEPTAIPKMTPNVGLSSHSCLIAAPQRTGGSGQNRKFGVWSNLPELRVQSTMAWWTSPLI
jgi:hypothetical protein